MKYTTSWWRLMASAIIASFLFTPFAATAEFISSLEITKPAENATVSGTVDFEAIYTDEDGDDAVQWAVREGTCAIGTGTVAGNVDGYNTPFDWDNETFTASIDMSTFADGDYCFVVNPVEDSGDGDLRATRNFTLSTPVAPEQVMGMDVVAAGERLGCYAYVSDRGITVDWDDSAAADLDYYEYQADSDKVEPYDFTTNTSISERSGQIRDEDGTYHYRARAVSTAGLKSEWSEWCGVTLDRQAPVVTIDSPVDGDAISGVVDVDGTVLDDNLSHYNASLYPAGADVNDFSLRLDGQTVEGSEITSVATLWSFDSTVYDDGEYQIRLAARDLAGNRDLTTPEVGGDDSVHVISIVIDNKPDNISACKDGGWMTYGFDNQGKCISSLVPGAPANEPTDKNQCKKGEWEDYGFKNQGQCIRHVNTGQDSR